MYINGAGLLVSLAVLWYLARHGGGIANLHAVLLLCAAYALPIAVLEAVWLRNWNKTLRTAQTADGDPGRLGIKLLGLAATLGFVFLIYWLFPEYHGSFYERYYAMLRLLLPWFLVLALPYFLLVDRFARRPRDGYWHLGHLCLGAFDRVDFHQVGQHLLGWLVKVYFLPLMFIYMSDSVLVLRGYDFSLLWQDFKSFYDFAFKFLFYIDLLIVTVGYMSTFTVTDSHIRTTEPTFLGWGVALLCYQPMWSFVSANYLDYSPERAWGAWFWGDAVLYPLWGSLILVSIGIYVWSSVPFGLRFSNLTHRGIITNGPYRYCKHPAYLSKNISWWLISMPFMINTTPEEALRHSLLLLGLNFIYLMRARTEERHLSWDPDYRAYAAYIEEYGLLRWVGRALPVLRFREGRLFNTAVTPGIPRQ